MTYYYAVLVGGVCCAIQQTAAPLTGSQYVEISGLDPAYLGRTYSGGAWV